MTLKIIIQNVTGLEIKFLGDLDQLRQAEEVLSSSCCIWNRGSKAIDWEDMNNPKSYPSFYINIYSLYNCNGDQTVAQVILKFMDDNKFTISPRNRYLLQYWDYEASMVVKGKSDHKSDGKYPSHLTSPVLLNAILDECEKKKYLPGFEQLFLLLEYSENIKNDYLDPELYFCKPFQLALDEVEQFIKKNENNLYIISNDSKTYGKYELLLFNRNLTKIDTDYIPKHSAIIAANKYRRS